MSDNPNNKKNQAMHKAVKERHEHQAPLEQQNDEAERNANFQTHSQSENSKSNKAGSHHEEHSDDDNPQRSDKTHPSSPHKGNQS